MLLEMPGNKAISVKEIARATCMVTEDVIGTLVLMGVGEGGKGKRTDGSVAVGKAVVRKWLEGNRIDVAKDVIDTTGLVEWSGEEASDDGDAEEEDE